MASEKQQETGAKPKPFRAIKGTRDILPPDSALWNRVEQAAREVFAAYNFGEIRTPIFEETELFARSIGAETDVVAKEMYTFEDYDLPDLEVWRNAVVTGARPSLTDAHSVLERYETDVRTLIGMVRDHIERREVPASAENTRLLTQMETSVSRMTQFFDQQFQPPGSRTTGWDEGFEQHGTAIARCARLLHFGDVLTLRPEATASVCRAYIEHGMHTWPQPVKLYYIGPMFRRERPQKGRYRQFYQIGAEVLGQTDAPALDAEVIEMLLTFFARAGQKETKLYINSIGHAAEDCRPVYVEKLREALRGVKDKLGPDSQRRIETNPLRVLDSKLAEEQPVIESLPRISDHLCGACREHFARLKDELRLRGIAFEENWRLVRGLDYYTRTTFEVTAAGLGSQNAVCGGGRYDGLVKLLGGPPTKGIGFAIGTDRLILSLQGTATGSANRALDVFIAWMGQEAYAPAVAIARKLRDAGLAVEMPIEEMKFKKSLGLADKVGARYALIIGGDEVASGMYTLKRLADAHQEKLSEAALLKKLKAERQGGSGE